jgi:hypothetical protein
MFCQCLVGKLSQEIVRSGKEFLPASLRGKFFQQQATQHILLTLGKL